MKTEDILRELCMCGGVSGAEDSASQKFVSLAKPYCGEINKDSMGNVWLCKKGSAKRKTLMIEAHADKIGLIVTGITDDGYLLFRGIGGIDSKILPSVNVTVHGKRDLKGIIGSVPPHLRKKQKFSVDDLCIDIGYGAETARSLVRVGDLVEFDTNYTELCGDYAAAGAFDDRAGLAAVIKTLEYLKDSDVNIVSVASSQEEVGCRGAKAAAYSINPDMYICIDVTFGKTPDSRGGVFPLGGGTVITVGPNVQPYMSRKLKEIADNKKIPYSIDADGGNTGTNAWTVQVARCGIPTALLSVPLRYMHTRYEVISVKDVEYTAKLTAEFAKEMC